VKTLKILYIQKNFYGPKCCQLKVSLSIIQPQLNLTKLKLENLKFGFKCKRERY